MSAQGAAELHEQREVPCVPADPWLHGDVSELLATVRIAPWSTPARREAERGQDPGHSDSFRGHRETSGRSDLSVMHRKCSWALANPGRQVICGKH